MIATTRSSHHRPLVRALFVAVALLVLVTGVAIGLTIRQFSAGAAPGDITACVNNYTGAVRMNAFGVLSCSASETEVTWAGMDTIGLHNTYTQPSANTQVDPGMSGTIVVECGPGDVVTGGGYSTASDSNVRITTNAPGIVSGTWIVAVSNDGVIPEHITGYAHCATP